MSKTCHPQRSASQSHREGRSRRTRHSLSLPLILLPFCLCAPTHAQTHAQTRLAVADPPLTASAPIMGPAAAPTQPPTQTFHDPTYHLSFDYPANWTFSHADGEISTFHLDARSAPRATSFRAVVAFPENPFPESTFSGAYVYFSVTPRSSSSACSRQARSITLVKNIPRTRPGSKTRVADILFTRGHDEQRDICITQRDEIYTTRHRGACYRFDLASNNFCGGEVSGVKDITPAQLDQVRARLESILNTIRFDPK